MKITEFPSQPSGSIILSRIDDEVDYICCYGIQISNDQNLSIDYLTTLLFSSFPSWINPLLKLRDFLVKPFGIETGLMPELRQLDKSLHYKKGETAVFFDVVDRSENEIVMGKDDKHLYVGLSFLADKPVGSASESVYLTIILQFHNAFGRFYFMLIKPFHKIIVRSLLKNFSYQLRGA